MLADFIIDLFTEFHTRLESQNLKVLYFLQDLFRSLTRTVKSSWGRNPGLQFRRAACRFDSQ